ncbi:hypothetical protein P7K49_014856, partial [Saguinus oedipus]
PKCDTCWTPEAPHQGPGNELETGRLEPIQKQRWVPGFMPQYPPEQEKLGHSS